MTTRSINICFDGWRFNNVELNNPDSRDSIDSDVTQITITTLENLRGFRVSFENERGATVYQAYDEFSKEQNTTYDLMHDQVKTTTRYENEWSVFDVNQKKIKTISTPNFISKNYSFNPQPPRDEDEGDGSAGISYIVMAPAVFSALYFLAATIDTNLKPRYAHITAATLSCFAFILLPIVTLVFGTSIKSWWIGRRDQFDFSNKLITVVNYARCPLSHKLDLDTALVFKPPVQS
jgi:hypothetical protein